MLVFNRAPKSFNINVIQCPAFAIHADGDGFCFQILYILLTGKLATLVAVEDFGFAMLSHGFFEHLQAGRCFQRVGQAPAYDIAAKNIYDGCQT